MKECVGDGDAGETETGRCLCTRPCMCGGGGGYEWEMSCSDVTSTVSRQDAGMCHTDEGRGRMGEKSKCTMKCFLFSPPLQSCCFICGRGTVDQTWTLSCCWQRC